MDQLVSDLGQIVGPSHVLTGTDMARYSSDWLHQYKWQPRAIIRPATAEQVSEVVKLVNQMKIPLVPMGGNTGLAGGTCGEAALVLSLERMAAIREIRPKSKVAIVEAGVILSNLHAAADAEDLLFPLTFGARGSATLGGVLSTNAGGSNVLRYGNTRDLCLGLEVVLPNGEIMNLMSELHKDNSGYNLKHLMIGAEGTLGIITAAVMKLQAKPKVYATAMIATTSLGSALTLLNDLQHATGGAVEAFEYMPRFYMEQHQKLFPNARQPFAQVHDTNILIELASTSADLAAQDAAGQSKLMQQFEALLAAHLEAGAILDAVVAQNQAQRVAFWERREQAAEVTASHPRLVNNDIALPLESVAAFLDLMKTRLAAIDPQAEALVVSHLGDGNVHYAVWPASHDKAVHDDIIEAVEDVTLSMGGSFSAEHGIGLTKLPSMRRRKNKAALQAMRAIKHSLDPNNIMNPGKVVPAAN